MSYEPTSQRRTDSHASGTHAASRSGIGFDPVALARKYPHLQPVGAHSGFPPIPLHRPITLIGSRKTARIHLSSPSVSKAHVLIVVTPHRVYACDLLSREGTFVKGRLIKEIELREGDDLRVGNFSFTFHDPRPRLPFEPPALDPMILEADLPTGRKSLVLQKRVTLIGRRAGSDLQLPFSNVSTANTAVVRLEGFAGESDSMAFKGYAVFDLGGKGTMLGRRPVHKNRLNVGDEIRIGGARIRVVSQPSAQEIAEPAAAPEARAPVTRAPAAPPAYEAPASTSDFDEILLDEGLTKEGVEEDVLGGSHVMPAISEPPPLEARETEAARVEEAMPFEAEPDATDEDDALPGFEADRIEEPGELAPSAAEALADHPVDDWGEANEPFPLEDAVIAPSSGPWQGAASDEHIVPLAEEESHAQWPPPEDGAVPFGVTDKESSREVVATGGSVVEFSISDSFAGDEHEAVHGASGSVIDATIEEHPPSQRQHTAEPSGMEPGIGTGSQAVEEVEPRWPAEARTVDEDQPEAADETHAASAPAVPEDEVQWPIEELLAEDPGADAPPVVEPREAQWPTEEALADIPEPSPVAETREEAIEPHWQAREVPRDEWDDSAVAEAGIGETAEAEDPLIEMAGETADPEASDVDLSRLDFDTAPPAEEFARAGPEKEAEEPEQTPIREPIMPPVEPAAPPVERPARAPRRKGTGRRKPERGTPGIAAMFEPEAFAEIAEPAEGAEAQSVADDGLEAPALAGREAEECIAAVDVDLDGVFFPPVAPEQEESDAQAEARSLPEDRPGTAIGAMDASDTLGLSDSVTEETDASPESALDLSELGLAASEESPELRDTPSLSDSAFAMELEAMGNEDAGDLVGAGPPAAQPEPTARLPETPARHEDPKPVSPPPPERRPAAPPNWRDEWSRQGSAFLGNITPLDPTPSLPISTPRRPFITPQPAARKPASPEPHEQAPEGLGQDFATRQPERPAPQRTAHGQPQVPASGSSVATPAVPSQPKAEPVSAGQSEPGARQKPSDRPKTVGFAGAVAEVEQAVARNARNPFSSAPIASGGGDPHGMLDPSAVIPETSGLVGFAGLQSAPPSREPVMSPPPAPAVEAGKPGQLDPSHAPHPRLIPDSVEAGALDDDIIDEQARVDEFVRTIRGGLGRSQAPTPIDKDKNGHSPTGFPPRDGGAGFLRAESIQPQPVPRGPAASEAVPVEQLPGKRRSTWLVPLLIGLMVVAMMGAVAGIYYGMQPTVPVTLMLRYDIPPALMEQEQALALHRKEQLDLLRYDDAVRQGALDVLQRISPNVAPAYLNDLQAFNFFAHNSVSWHDSERNTLVLRREVIESERQAEMARLKAVGLAMYDQGATARATRDLLTDQGQQLEGEIEKLLRESQGIGRDIEELLASLPRAGGDSADRQKQEDELADRIETLVKQWNDADREVSALKSQLTSLESGNPLSRDEQLAELKRRLVDVEARLASAAQGGAAREERAEPAGSRVSPADADPAAAPTLEKITEELPTDARELQALIEQRMQRVTEVADAAGAGDGEEQLLEGVVEFNRLTAQLIDEIVPRHVLKAGEVEMLHQALLRTRRQRMVERLDADESVRTLRGEIALKERELGAAISDGLTTKASGLRMALRVSRDRLSLRTSQIEAELGEDPDVSAATASYEKARDDALKSLREQRAAFEKELGARRQGLLVTAEQRGIPTLARAIAELDNAVQALVLEKTRGLSVSEQVWSPQDSDAEPDSQASPAEEDQELSAAGPQMVSFEMSEQEVPPASQPADLEAQANELRRQISEREESLREAHATRLSELRLRLAAREAAALKAQSEAQQARTQLTKLQAGEQATERELQRLTQLRTDKHDKDTLLEEKRAELAQARTKGGILPTPLRPTDADIEAPLHVKDDRPLVMVAALLGILAIFLVPLYFTMRSDIRS